MDASLFFLLATYTIGILISWGIGVRYTLKEYHSHVKLLKENKNAIESGFVGSFLGYDMDSTPWPNREDITDLVSNGLVITFAYSFFWPLLFCVLIFIMPFCLAGWLIRKVTNKHIDVVLSR